MREAWLYRSSRELFIKHPIHEDTVRNPLDNTTDSATASFTVFDSDIEESISSAEGAGQTILSITNAGEFSSETSIEVLQDDGTSHISTIVSVDVANGTVTITPGITVNSAAGNRVRSVIGASAVSMAEFGTPDLDTEDWGFRGVLVATHAAVLKIERKIDVELTLIFGTLRSVQTLCAVIRNSC